jgi:type IV pilus assembly protein PilQ
MKTARRFIASLALAALVSNVFVLAGTRVAGKSRPDGQAFTLVSLKTESEGGLTRILIESNAPPLYTVFRPTDRLILVDLPGGEGSQLAPQYAANSSLVETINVRKSRIGAASRATTRVEIAVRGRVRDKSRVNGNTLIIELSGAEAAAEPAKAKAAEPAKAEAETSGVHVQPLPVAKTNTTAAADRARPQPAALKPATLVRAVRQATDGGAFRIIVDADGAAQFKDFMLADPWRVVVDVTGVHSAFGNKTFPVNSASVERLRVGQPSPSVVRIVVDLKAKTTYRVERDGSQLVITIGGGGTSRVNNVKPEVVAPQPSAAEVKVAGQRVDNDKAAQSEPASKPVANPAAQHSTPQPSTPQPSTPQPLAMNQPAPVAPGTANNTQPPPSNTVRSLMDAQRSAQPNTVPPGVASSPAPRQQGQLAFCDQNFVGGPISFDLRAGVDIRDMLRFVSQQYGVNFILDKSVGPVPVDIRVTDIPWNQVIDSVLRANRLGAVCESSGRMIRVATLVAIKEEEQQQREIAEEQNKKEPLETKIIHLRYARAAGSLGNTGSGASGRGGGGGGGGGGGAGGGGGQGTGTLLGIANARLSPRGRIEMDLRTNTLIVTDLPVNVKAVSDIITQLDKPEPQVEIEARIVIANRSFLRDIGSELGAAAINRNQGSIGLLETGAVKIDPSGSVTTPDGQGGGGAKGDGAAGAGGSSNTGQIGPNLLGPFSTNALRNGAANTVLSLTTGLIGTSIISMALSASERKGQVRIIASPRITAQDNQTAEIINGVQIPVQTTSNNTITTTFVTAALRLEITPQIIEETGEVLMHVVAENNTVNSALATQLNGGTPGINTQAAESVVRVQDGGTTVMGGVNIDTEANTQNRTPGMSRIPVLGHLFKRQSTERSMDEILFFITPRIIRQDGTMMPRQQRSSLEGTPNPAGPQRAVAPATVSPNVNAKAQNNPQPAASGRGGH